MAKYEQLQRDVLSIFGTAGWIAENIETFPSGMSVQGVTEFIRVSAIAQGPAINSKSASGLVMIEIFTTANEGPLRASIIADKLDQYLLKKSVTTGTNVTQFHETSSLRDTGHDPANSALLRSFYSVGFNHFEVQ